MTPEAVAVEERCEEGEGGTERVEDGAELGDDEG